MKKEHETVTGTNTTKYVAQVETFSLKSHRNGLVIMEGIDDMHGHQTTKQ